MDLPVRKRLPYAIPQWVPTGSSFFITMTCVPRGENQLCRPEMARAILEAFKHNHEKLAWHCRIVLLMPDHLHAILAFPEFPGMKTAIRNWKRFSSRQFGVRWQRDFFDHRLRNKDELDEKLSYILLNPVRKGLCQEIEDWKWVYRPNDRPPPILG